MTAVAATTTGEGSKALMCPTRSMIFSQSTEREAGEIATEHQTGQVGPKSSIAIRRETNVPKKPLAG
jgi:hypothetical protein